MDKNLKLTMDIEVTSAILDQCDKVENVMLIEVFMILKNAVIF